MPQASRYIASIRAEEAEQEDKLFRWLRAKRDYPYIDDPAPFAFEATRERCVREFCRSNPGFTI
jgi:hypothetical protein